MKRIIPAIALGMLMSGGCTDARSDLIIEGVDIPATGTCIFTPSDASVLLQEGTENVFLQAILNGELSRFIGFQVENTLKAPPIEDPGNNPTSDPKKDDVAITEVDIDVTDTTGAAVASEALVADAYVQAGGNGVVIPDVMGKPVADALRALVTFPAKRPATTVMLFNVTAKGHLISGGNVESSPFQFPVQVRFDDPFATPVGNGVVQTVALLPDGGHADEVILADGTPVLGDAFTLADGGLGITDGGTTLSDAAIANFLAAESADGGGGTTFSGVAPCE